MLNYKEILEKTEQTPERNQLVKNVVLHEKATKGEHVFQMNRNCCYSTDLYCGTSGLSNLYIIFISFFIVFNSLLSILKAEETHTHIETMKYK